MRPAVIFKQQVAGKPLFKQAVKRDAVLIVGPSGSGKTTLFSQLCHGHVPEFGTVTSIKESEGRAADHDGLADLAAATPIIDVPGLQRLRDRSDTMRCMLRPSAAP